MVAGIEDFGGINPCSWDGGIMMRDLGAIVIENGQRMKKSINK